MDAVESLGATYKGKQNGGFGNYNATSFNGNNVFETEMMKFDCKESTKIAT